MYTHHSFKTMLVLSAGLLLTAPACSSTGVKRVGAVGAAGQQGEPGPQGEQGDPGPQGPAGPQGAPGPQGPAGPQGSEGEQGSFGLGAAGALAVGGLVGPEGVAGTGLFANTGDPAGAPLIVSGVLVKSGHTVNLVADKGLKAAALVDHKLPGATPIAGTVVGVVEATGQTLIQTGKGEAFLVDGLTAAPGALVTASIGEAFPIGSPEADSLIGASLLSPDQTKGDLLTVGLGSDGELLSLEGDGILKHVDLHKDIDLHKGGGLLKHVDLHKDVDLHKGGELLEDGGLLKGGDGGFSKITDPVADVADSLFDKTKQDHHGSYSDGLDGVGDLVDGLLGGKGDY